MAMFLPGHSFIRAGIAAGPVLLLIANLAGVNQTGTDAQTLDYVAAHQAGYLASTVVLLLGFGLLLPAGPFLATPLTGRRWALGTVGAAFAVVGAFACLVTNSGYLLSARMITLPGIDRTAALAIKRVGDEDGGIGLFVMLTPLMAVGFLLLAVGLVLEHLLSVAAAVALAGGALAAETLEVLGAGTPALAAALLVLAAGMAAVAFRSGSWPAPADTRNPRLV